MAKELDVNKAFEAIARIMSQREGVQVTVKSVTKIDKSKQVAEENQEVAV